MMLDFKGLAAIAAAFLLPGGILAGTAEAASQWDHNNSVMRLDEDGKKRRFIYDEPRQSLAGAGVKSGTVLFEGEEKADGRLAGYAKLFRKGCSPIDYFVEGAYDKDKGEILLQGQVPIYSGEGCKITGYTDDGSASSLRFTRLDGGAGRYAGLGGQETPGRDEAEIPGYQPRFQERPVEREQTFQGQGNRGEFGREDGFGDEDGFGEGYGFRERRAERDGRYDEEDAEFYGEFDEDREEALYGEEDGFGEYDEYDEESAYFARRRWWEN